MLPEFEDIIEDLSIDEKAQCRIVWAVMNHAFKSGRAITNNEIRDQLAEHHGIVMGQPKLRQMIAWMHINEYLPGLMASSRGYSRARTKKELLEYQNSLEGRIRAIQARYNAVHRDLKNFK